MRKSSTACFEIGVGWTTSLARFSSTRSTTASRVGLVGRNEQVVEVSTPGVGRTQDIQDPCRFLLIQSADQLGGVLRSETSSTAARPTRDGMSAMRQTRRAWLIDRGMSWLQKPSTRRLSSADPLGDRKAEMGDGPLALAREAVEYRCLHRKRSSELLLRQHPKARSPCGQSRRRKHANIPCVRSLSARSLLRDRSSN